jgi:hypothetical protein
MRCVCFGFVCTFCSKVRYDKCPARGRPTHVELRVGPIWTRTEDGTTAFVEFSSSSAVKIDLYILWLLIAYWQMERFMRASSETRACLKFYSLPSVIACNICCLNFVQNWAYSGIQHNYLRKLTLRLRQWSGFFLFPVVHFFCQWWYIRYLNIISSGTQRYRVTNVVLAFPF